MDTRAFRLDWPAGLVLYEIDRDDVLDHKEAVLTRLNAQPACDRRIVRADLSGQWTGAVVNAEMLVSRYMAAYMKTLDELGCPADRRRPSNKPSADVPGRADRLYNASRGADL